MRILSDDPGRSGARAASGIIDDVTSAKYSLIASLALAAMSAHIPLLEVVLSLLRAASGVIALPDVNHTVPAVLLNVSFGSEIGHPVLVGPIVVITVRAPQSSPLLSTLSKRGTAGCIDP